MDKARLIEDINLQIGNLERLNKEINELLAQLKEAPDFIQIRACASILQDFYSGIEKIFERIALMVDSNLPQGENWHIELLPRMAKPFANIRPAIVSEDLYEKLKEYLKLRHLARHIYGFKLQWERLKPLVFAMSDVFDDFKKDIGKFLDYLGSEKQSGE